MVSLFNYFLVTNFFWMLVEGLYLHVVIVWTFSTDRLRLRHCAALGWGECTDIHLFIGSVARLFLEVRTVKGKNPLARTRGEAAVGLYFSGERSRARSEGMCQAV